MSEDDDNVEHHGEEPLEPGEETGTSEEGCFEEEEEQVLVAGPFAVLMQSLDFLHTAWEHAVGKDDFDKMMLVVDKTLDINDRYMAVHLTQEDSNERVNRTEHPEQFGFSAEINNRERPPDVKSR